MVDLLKFLPLLFFIFVAVSIARNVSKVARKLNQDMPPRNSPDYDPALAERTRRIQAEIRRKIAERRGLVVPPLEPAPEAPAAPPFLMVEDDPAEPAAAPAPEPTQTAILERQQQLADQMRALEDARVTVLRRAAELTAAETAEDRSERGQIRRSRDDLLADLRDPAGLRRAILMREILGPPVGLR